jgi:GIY-YIG catalytic domain
MIYQSILNERAPVFRRLVLIPAQTILSEPSVIPQTAGTYLFFATTGITLLRATGYFRCDTRQPIVHRDRVHLYTGRSDRMRTRIRCHLLGSAEQSCLRKTLIAIEHACGGLTKTHTLNSEVFDRHSFNAWLATNSSFAFVTCDDAIGREQELLRVLASPLNLRPSTNLTFANQLLRWREKYYPRDGAF